MAGLLTVQEAQQRILASFQPVGEETVPLERCAGRVLAVDIRAPGDLPPFDNSSMDGYAVRSADVSGADPDHPVTLAVIADIPAGGPCFCTIDPGQAARIMTGAPLPDGADAVVPVEETGQQTGFSGPTELGEVRILRAAQPGAYIRRRGQDVHQGQVLLEKGRALLPQDLGVIASIGQPQVAVFRRPRVALFSSGDELVPPGQPLGPGQIYDSNGYVLAAMLARAGAEVLRLGTAPDDPQQIEQALSRAIAEHADLIVTSAGVSVGAFDYVRQVIESRGSLDFWKVNMRPGKPLAFGAFSGIPLIGLPGNPVSAFVGCQVFVLPVIERLSGRAPRDSHRRMATLAEPIESDGRESYLRAVVTFPEGKPTARLTGHQGSGNLYSLVQANALLVVPSGVKSLPSGAEVEIWFFDDG